MKKLIALLFCLATSPLMFAQTGQQPHQFTLSATSKIFAQVGGGTSHGIDLTWAKSPTSAVTGYNIYRSSSAGVCSFPSGTASSQTAPSGCLKVGSSSTLTFSDSSSAVQAEGSTFRYVVTAVSPGGESASSNEASATVPFQIPAAPTTLQTVSH